MRLLGIYINQKSPVSKLLEPGWYPFGNYRKPNKNGFVVRNKAVPAEIEDIYSSYFNDSEQSSFHESVKPSSHSFAKTSQEKYLDLPDICVSAIVGKNGSGKSTLIEILFRIINNFTKVVLGKARSENYNRRLSFAYNLFASLHYEIDGQQYEIECENIKVNFYKVFLNQPKDQTYIKFGAFGPNKERSNKILSDFFYTIAVNYSLYAYNWQDYGFETVGASRQGIEGGEWLNGLFHKNDGYFTPIVLTPYRNNGKIDIAKEEQLALQRIVKMSILAEDKGYHFLPGYAPYRIEASFNHHYKDSKTKDIEYIISERFKQLKGGGGLFISELSKAWRKKLNLGRLQGDPKRVIDTAVYYLAYKSIKIMLLYPDYTKWLKLEKFTQLSVYFVDIFPQVAKEIVAGFYEECEASEKVSHLILKLKQVKNFIEFYQKHDVLEWQTQDSKSVNELLKGVNDLSLSKLTTLLPPPFYNLDLTFKRVSDEKATGWEFSGQDELKVSRMSSGERQFLYAISYVLYHVKNIESIRKDDERVEYRNICLIFDEVELYFHPEYQRNLIVRLIEALRWCRIDRNRLQSIQILLVTHSPFVLSDVFSHNTMYLDDNGKSKIVEAETFGANYYTMLANSFFFRESAVGDVSTNFVADLIIKAKQGLLTKDSESLNFVGDEFIRNYIRSLLPGNEDFSKYD